MLDNFCNNRSNLSMFRLWRKNVSIKFDWGQTFWLISTAEFFWSEKLLTEQKTVRLSSTVLFVPQNCSDVFWDHEQAFPLWSCIWSPNLLIQLTAHWKDLLDILLNFVLTKSTVWLEFEFDCAVNHLDVSFDCDKLMFRFSRSIFGNFLFDSTYAFFCARAMFCFSRPNQACFDCAWPMLWLSRPIFRLSRPKLGMLWRCFNQNSLGSKFCMKPNMVI